MPPSTSEGLTWSSGGNTYSGYTDPSSGDWVDTTPYPASNTIQVTAPDIGTVLTPATLTGLLGSQFHPSGGGGGYLGGIQTSLNIVGSFPVVGEFANAANMGISLYEGDYVGAGVSAFAMLPVVGTIGNLARFGRVVEDLSVASSAGGRVLPMTIVRIVNHGEKIADIVNEGKGLTFTTENEHALVTLTNGDRAIVSGGPGGISFPEGSITKIFGHTHPTSAPPSDADSIILQKLNQSQQTVFHGGVVSKVRQ